MDQAPAALSNILGSAFNEIREEVNELKQSNTSLLNKVEGLEVGLIQFHKLNGELATSVVNLTSRAETSEKQFKESCAKVSELVKALYRTVSNVTEQKTAAEEIRVSLAQAKNEIAALKLLLTAKNEVSSVEAGTEEREQTPQPEDSGETAAEEEPNEFFSPRSFTRESSSESSGTFCNTQQSATRRKRQFLGLVDRAIPVPPVLQGPAARPDGGFFVDKEDNKRQKMSLTRAQSIPGEGSPLKEFTVPDLAIHETHEKTQHSIPRSTKELLDGGSSYVGHDVIDDDVDMSEDNIRVAPKDARSAFALSESNPATAPTSQSSVAKSTQVLNEKSAHQDPDVTDQDTGILHQPSNRGENDQTGILGERLYQTISLDDGNTYTVDRSRAHVHNVQPWKSWAVKKNGVWYQWSSYSTLDWTDKAALAKMNGWREQALTRAGFPRKRLGGWKGTTVRTQVRFESEQEMGEEPEQAASQAFPVSKTPAKAVTRTYLLEQFQARTGEMQSGSRSQSGESD